jgi:hypothetical protein
MSRVLLPIDYKILKESSSIQLENTVLKHIKEGWAVMGAPGALDCGDQGALWYQGIIRFPAENTMPRKKP